MRPIIAISLLTLVACGGKKPAPDAAPAEEPQGTEARLKGDGAKLAEPDTTMTAPVKGETTTAKLATETRTFHAMARCTQMACPDDNKCCNSCSFFAWADDEGVTLEGADLPTCEVDGCGKCAQTVEASGTLVDGSFKAAEVKLVE